MVITRRLVQYEPLVFKKKYDLIHFQPWPNQSRLPIGNLLISYWFHRDSIPDSIWENKIDIRYRFVLNNYVWDWIKFSEIPEMKTSPNFAFDLRRVDTMFRLEFQSFDFDDHSEITFQPILFTMERIAGV